MKCKLLTSLAVAGLFVSVSAQISPSPEPLLPPKWPSPSQVGPDGLPVVFSLRPDALKTYVVEVVRKGTLYVSSPLLLSGKNGIMQVTVTGKDGAETISRLSNGPITFRVADPGNATVSFGSWFEASDGNVLLSGGMTVAPTLNNGVWTITPVPIKLGFFGTPEIKMPAGVTEIRVVGKDGNGNQISWSFGGPNANGLFQIDLRHVPANGDIIVSGQDSRGNPTSRAYDMVSGMPKGEMGEQTNVPLSVDGVLFYSDASMTAGDDPTITVVGIGAATDPVSPVVCLTLTRQRDVKVYAIVRDANQNVTATTTTVRMRPEGQFETTNPAQSGTDGLPVFRQLRPGVYYFLFDWGDSGLFPNNNPPQYDGKGY